MASLSSTHNLSMALSEHFAELCCASAILANQLLQSFPDYRRAKADLSDPFWRTRGQEMLHQVEQAEQSLESACGFLG